MTDDGDRDRDRDDAGLDDTGIDDAGMGRSLPRTGSLEIAVAVGVRVLPVLALVAALYLLLPFVPRPGSDVGLRIAGYLTTFVFFATLAAVGARGWLATRIGGWWLGAGAAVCIAEATLLTLAQAPIVSDLLKVLAAFLVGVLIAQLMEELWWAPAVALVIAVADIWSVYSQHGVTREIVEDHPRTLQVATIVVPVPGLDYSDLVGNSLVGIVDILFMTLFITVAALWNLGIVKNALVLAASFLITLVLATEVDALGGAVPALPVMSVLFVLVNAQRFAQSVREARASSRGDH